MAKREQNQCCHCATDGYPCVGERCANRRVIVYTCDMCKQVLDTLYDSEFGEVCEDCLIIETLKNTPKIA